MTRFNAKIGAGVLVGLAALYAGIALFTHHSARAEPPPDLSATEAGLDLWRSLVWLVDRQGRAVVDVRPAEEFARYHLPRSRNLAGASAKDLRAHLLDQGEVLLVAASDTAAARLAGELKASGAKAHYLKGGAAEWYLCFELPAPLFSSKTPPRGYDEALAVVRRWLAAPAAVPTARAREAVARLAARGFAPDQLGGHKKAAAGGAKKKIKGGCG
ncbi:MAG: rhodanese-like domain-containing protein [Acidobacteriota bacterium]